MTFGEKLARERKKCNYTQEQLAEILGVSRQSVSKWESDIAYPETEKLIKMGKLFGCSMDYLLGDGDRGGMYKSPLEHTGAWLMAQIRERKSSKTVMGMPLYHIGRDARGFLAVGLKARGVFAIGLRARGLVSLGLLSTGFLSVGLLSLGLLAFGPLAIGLLAVGVMALGAFAVGAVSVGIVAMGALSVGCFSAGAMAVGRYAAIGDRAHGMVAYGQSFAEGSLYSQIGHLSLARALGFHQALEGVAPSWLGWAKRLYLLILG